jgi:UDP-N-acetylglucosamine 4,6-dehydratase
MTRFWITLEYGVSFVINSFGKMLGGEIFIPKMPSIKIIDLAKSLNPKVKINYIGIRPGEKLHEVLVPADLSSQTFESKFFFTVLPSFSITNKNSIFKKYKSKFKLVKRGFEYNSQNNDHYLNISEITKLNKDYIKNQ